jgi:hypothetical protein
MKNILPGKPSLLFFNASRHQDIIAILQESKNNGTGMQPAFMITLN